MWHNRGLVLSKAMLPVNHWCEAKHARNNKHARSDRTKWDVFAAKSVNSDAKVVLREGMAALALEDLPLAYRVGPSTTALAIADTADGDDDDANAALDRRQASFVRSPIQLYHQHCINVSIVMREKFNAASAAYWAHVHEKFAALEPDELLAWNVRYARLRNLRETTKKLDRLADRPRDPQPQVVATPTLPAMAITATAFDLALVPSAASGSPAVPSLARAPGCLDLAPASTPMGKPASDASAASLVPWKKRSGSATNLTALVPWKKRSGGPTNLTVAAFIDKEPTLDCAIVAAIVDADPREQVPLKPLALTVFENHLAKIGKPRTGRDGRGITRTGYGARQQDWQELTQHIAADRGAVPEKVVYHNPCGPICNESKTTADRHRRTMSDRFKKVLLATVRRLGGPREASRGVALFALESYDCDGRATRVDVIWLSVCNGSPFYVVFTHNKFQQQPPPALPIANYAGLVVEFERLAYVKSRLRAIKRFFGPLGRLHHSMDDELISTIVADKRVPHLLFRQLAYTPLNGNDTRIDGVIGDAIPVEPPKRTRKTTKAKWDLLFEQGDYDDDGDAGAGGGRSNGGIGGRHGASANAADADAVPAAYHYDGRDGDGAGGVDAPAGALGLETDTELRSDPVLSGMASCFTNIDLELKRLVTGALTEAKRVQNDEETVQLEAVAADEKSETAAARLAAKAESSAPAAHGRSSSSSSCDGHSLVSIDLKGLDFSEALEQRYDVKIKFCIGAGSGSYEIQSRSSGPAAHVLGRIYTIGSGALKGECKRGHSDCNCFINPGRYGHGTRRRNENR